MLLHQLKNFVRILPGQSQLIRPHLQVSIHAHRRRHHRPRHRNSDIPPRQHRRRRRPRHRPSHRRRPPGRARWPSGPTARRPRSRKSLRPRHRRIRQPLRRKIPRRHPGPPRRRRQPHHRRRRHLHIDIHHPLTIHLPPPHRRLQRPVSLAEDRLFARRQRHPRLLLHENLRHLLRLHLAPANEKSPQSRPRRRRRSKPLRRDLIPPHGSIDRIRHHARPGAQPRRHARLASRHRRPARLISRPQPPDRLPRRHRQSRRHRPQLPERRIARPQLRRLQHPIILIKMFAQLLIESLIRQRPPDSPRDRTRHGPHRHRHLRQRTPRQTRRPAHLRPANGPRHRRATPTRPVKNRLQLRILPRLRLQLPPLLQHPLHLPRRSHPLVELLLRQQPRLERRLEPLRQPRRIEDNLPRRHHPRRPLQRVRRHDTGLRVHRQTGKFERRIPLLKRNIRIHPSLRVRPRRVPPPPAAPPPGWFLRLESNIQRLRLRLHRFRVHPRDPREVKVRR